MIAVVAASPLGGQVVRGTVVDASNERPVALAGVYLLDRERHTVLIAMADSLGRYGLSLPASGDYFLVAERFGYRDTESPLLSLTDSSTYALDLELRPEPLGLGGVTVTVSNETAIEWLTREFGTNPSGAFGFRLLQGERLAEAKAKGRNRPTETLRWLYVPVSHGLECVAINATPRAVTVGFRGPRQGGFGDLGDAPVGTQDIDRIREEYARARDDPSASARCGSLMVNDRLVPNANLDDLDMSSIAVVVTLPGVVRMYTYDFDWSFR